MRVTKTICALLIFLCFVLVLGCDGRKGILTEKETNRLYSEMKTAIQDGDLWRLKPEYIHRVDSIDNNLSFFRFAAEAVFGHEDQIERKIGRRYAQRTGKMLYLRCQVLLVVDGNEYTIDEVDIAKIDDRDVYELWVYFHCAGEEEKKYMNIKLQ